MSPRTPTQPPNDARMWKRLVSRAHPDAGGDHDLFIWASATREAVCGGELGGEIPRRPDSHAPAADSDRIGFESAFRKAESFSDLTRQAVELANSGDIPKTYAVLLLLLADCQEASRADAMLFRQQRQGATYKQLAAIAHSLSMTKAERVGWYRVAERVPLSVRHAGHILSKLKRRAA
ncbi:MAG: hypothetical protein M3Q60_20335 [Actinomycetota bacterium]|nr:hypothetical protein [Actinomycetota bacterium]